MSSSTLPKSVQAQNSANLDGGDTSGLSDSRSGTQRCKDFVHKYKQLPDDFLRIPASYYSANSLQDNETAAMAHRLLTNREPLVDMIDISVVEAQLVKNYGLLRMDLYCKIRVGHMVCETPTCPNGAKNPKWDGVYQFSLKPGIDSFHLEIYDEKQFSLDEKIAWLHEPIPQEIFRGITVERWFPLSGRLGQQKEGSVLLVLSHKRVPMRASNFGRSGLLSHQPFGRTSDQVFIPGPGFPHLLENPYAIPPGSEPRDPMNPAFMQQPPTQPHINTTTTPTTNVYADPPPTVDSRHPAEPINVRQASEEDITQLREMFPFIDRAIIKAILENNNHDKEASISALLAMG